MEALVSGPLILFVGAIYAYVAVDQYLANNIGMCIAFAGYAFANLGLFMLAR